MIQGFSHFLKSVPLDILNSEGSSLTHPTDVNFSLFNLLLLNKTQGKIMSLFPDVSGSDPVSCHDNIIRA